MLWQLTRPGVEGHHIVQMSAEYASLDMRYYQTLQLARLEAFSQQAFHQLCRSAL